MLQNCRRVNVEQLVFDSDRSAVALRGQVAQPGACAIHHVVQDMRTTRLEPAIGTRPFPTRQRRQMFTFNSSSSVARARFDSLWWTMRSVTWVLSLCTPGPLMHSRFATQLPSLERDRGGNVLRCDNAQAMVMLEEEGCGVQTPPGSAEPSTGV